MGVRAEDIHVGLGLRTLQAAIGNATNGDVIRIQAGTYEGAGYCGLLVDKSISILGQEPVLIDCKGQDRVLDVQAPITIDGITFMNGYRGGKPVLENARFERVQYIVLVHILIPIMGEYPPLHL